MRHTRITALGCLALAIVACGIDAVGAKPSDALSDDGGASSSSSSSSSGDPGGEDSGVVTPDASSDAPADVVVDVAPDVAPLVPPYLNLTHQAAAGTINLTTEGAKEWAYWGVDANANSLRNAGATNIISAINWDGAMIEGANTGLGVMLAWTNGPTGTGNQTRTTDWYRSFGTSAGGYIYVRAPSGPIGQTFTVVLGGANVVGRMTVSFIDGSTPAKFDTSYGNLAGTFAAKYSVEFASVGVTQVEMRWTPETLGTNAELRFAAAALR